MLRLLSRRGLEDFTLLAGTSLFERFMADGRLVRTELVEGVADLPQLRSGPPAGVLRHERVPFLSYPYEWTFGMLRDAALLHLELMTDALEEGLVLKDASPYNVQFVGAQPVFIDVGSFERLREGEPWGAYRQLCMQMLFPLMLTAFKGIPHQSLLRGRLDGITPAECRALMSFRDRLRRGTTGHVFLHARLDATQARAGDTRDVKSELRSAGFKSDLIKANVRRLTKLVRRLEWDAAGSAWTDYQPTTSYTPDDAAAKSDFVDQALATRSWRTVWDLGCNDGRFSRVAAGRADRVVAVDSDPVVVERLYRSLRSERSRTILPLTMSLSDQSPSLGWRGRERPAFDQRGRPDLTLCLALLHHVTITENIPLRSFVQWLADLGAALVVEFADREDPQVQSLLARKPPGSNPDYSLDHFEQCLEERFVIDRRTRIAAGARTLYFAEPRVARHDAR